jgi:RNA polymerase sigma-70 factor (ECF subfamily)
MSNGDERERAWAVWMAAALDGDEAAYRRFLESVTPVLRAGARRSLARSRAPAGDAEDIVQETLLAIHLKRATWRRGEPIGPWIAAIARYKYVDVIRRQSRRAEVPIDDMFDLIPDASDPEEELGRRQAEQLVGSIKGRQGDVVRSVTVEGVGIRDTAKRFGMTEGAVRVALHRGLKALAALYREGEE